MEIPFFCSIDMDNNDSPSSSPIWVLWNVDYGYPHKVFVGDLHSAWQLAREIEDSLESNGSPVRAYRCSDNQLYLTDSEPSKGSTKRFEFN